MTVTVKALTDAELAAGLVLIDPLLFRMYWFQDEFTLPPSREQKLMFCDESQRVLLCTARKTGKTVNLEAVVLQISILNQPERAGGVDEAMFFTPGESHLVPFMDRLFNRISKEPILRGFFKVRRGESPTLESPSLRVYFRVEGFLGTDRNMVGLRAKYIIGDELAFGNQVCHNSRLQTALPGCRWWYAGVPNGVRNTPFWRIDQTLEGSNWSRHKYTTFINPLYASEESKKELEKAYGSKNTQGYITQVLGLWGEELLSSFPPGSIAIRDVPYFTKTLSAITQKEELLNLPLMLGIPSIRVARFCAGLDYGFSPDPSELIFSYQAREDTDEWQAYCRIEMRRVAMPRQVDIILYAIQHIFFGEFAGLSSDNVGVIQSLQNADPEHQDLYMHSSPAGVTKVKIIEYGEEKEVNIRNKEYYVGMLKRFLMNAVVGLFETRLYLANDAEAINELVGTTERRMESGYTMYYGPPDPNSYGSGHQLDHIREGLTYMCYAISLANRGEEDSSDDELWAALGWVGDPGWTPVSRSNE